MLVFDPEKRITVEQALKHPYLAELHCEEDEPTGEPVSHFDFDFEFYSLHASEYKELIYEEIMLYHEEEAVQRYIQLKSESPDGILQFRYGKDRLREMYKKDGLIKDESKS